MPEANADELVIELLSPAAHLHHAGIYFRPGALRTVGEHVSGHAAGGCRAGVRHLSPDINRITVRLRGARERADDVAQDRRGHFGRGVEDRIRFLLLALSITGLPEVGDDVEIIRREHARVNALFATRAVAVVVVDVNGAVQLGLFFGEDRRSESAHKGQGQDCSQHLFENRHWETPVPLGLCPRRNEMERAVVNRI